MCVVCVFDVGQGSLELCVVLWCGGAGSCGLTIAGVLFPIVLERTVYTSESGEELQRTMLSSTDSDAFSDTGNSTDTSLRGANPPKIIIVKHHHHHHIHNGEPGTA